MRSSAAVLLLVLGGILQAKPDRTDEPKPESPFKPIEIKNELKNSDPNDDKLNKPAKKYTVKLAKDKAYVVDLTSSDFDPYLRVLEKSGAQLVEDLEGSGNGVSRLVVNPTDSGDHQIVVTSFDGEVGKFVLKVRELNLQGEAKARDIGKKGLDINDQVAEKDATDLGAFSKVLSVNLKAGKSYMIEADSKDFDCQLYLFNLKNKLLGQDHARVFHSPTADGEHRIVVSSLDSMEGKFTLKVRELNIKGEAKPRAVGKNGLKHKDDIDEKTSTELGDFSRVVSVKLKAGQPYMFDVKSDDFDTELYVFDGKSKLLAQDHAKVFHVPAANGVHHLVVKSFDSKEGKFNLDVQEFNLEGEAKPRDLGKNGLTIKGQINANDDTPVGKAGKVYSVEMKAGQTYTIELNSPDLDSYLYLFDAKSALLAQDDDSGGELNSRIVYRAERDGIYHIIATSLGGMDTGEFTLKVRKRE
jgi:Bacterial pre-peptidase C-terminal domain